MSAFDPDTFLHDETESAMETKHTPCPEGEYTAYIDNVEAQTRKTDDGPVVVMDIVYAVTDDEVKEELDMDKVIVRQSVWPDFDENGKLAFTKNKNVRLGNVREACGQNQDGKPWSPGMLVGAGPVKITVGHRFNKTTGEGPYANVTRVAAG